MAVLAPFLLESQLKARIGEREQSRNRLFCIVLSRMNTLKEALDSIAKFRSDTLDGAFFLCLFEVVIYHRSSGAQTCSQHLMDLHRVFGELAAFTGLARTLFRAASPPSFCTLN
jgi:hypothetical protein